MVLRLSTALPGSLCHIGHGESVHQSVQLCKWGLAQ